MAGVFALFVAALAVPGSAVADCSWRHEVSGPISFEQLILAGALAHSADDPAAPAPYTPSPCAGLRCSSDPLSPAPSVPPTPTRAAHESWGCLVGTGSSGTLVSRLHHSDEAAARPIHRPSSVFHPPR